MKPDNGQRPPDAPGHLDARERSRDAADVLRASFAWSLDEALRTEEPLGFDDIAAYVDGQMDDVEREVFENRLADDADLRAAVADLAAMRDAMPGRARDAGEGAGPAPVADGGQARPRHFGRGSSSWVLGVLAAAAGIVGTVIWLASTAVRQSPGGDSASSASTTGAPPRPAPASEPPAIALHDAGGVVSIDAAGAIAAPIAVPKAIEADAVAALRGGTLPPPALPPVLRHTAPLTLLGDQSAPAPFAVVSPVATVVREARPTLRWQPNPRARAYSVVVLTDSLEPVASIARITGTTWTVPKDLKPGTTYQWQVTALTADGRALALAPAPPLPEARFAVMTTAQRQAIDRQLDAVGSSNLLRGLILTRAGALDEAERAFVALAGENPTSTRARELLANLHTLRR